MNLLDILVGLGAIFWIVIGIRTHSDWIQSVFINESKKIQKQAIVINEFGYGTLNTRNKLAAKKGLVFAYWEIPTEYQEDQETSEHLKSPFIFQLVNLNLIAGTSILFLIALSKGLFASLGLI